MRFVKKGNFCLFGICKRNGEERWEQGEALHRGQASIFFFRKLEVKLLEGGRSARKKRITRFVIISSDENMSGTSEGIEKTYTESGKSWIRSHWSTIRTRKRKTNHTQSQSKNTYNVTEFYITKREAICLAYEEKESSLQIAKEEVIRNLSGRVLLKKFKIDR